MRSKTGLLIVVLVVAAVLTVAAGAPTGESSSVSQETAEKFSELDRLLDELIGLLQDPAMKPSDLSAKLEEAERGFGELLGSFPSVYGMSFADLCLALFSINESLSDAVAMAETGQSGLWAALAYHADSYSARREKKKLEWELSGGRLQEQMSCPNGRVLVIVYPGFDCHKLRAKLEELRAAGKCVTVLCEEAAGHIPHPDRPFGGGNAAKLYKCLGSCYSVGPTFEIDYLAQQDDPRFSEQYAFGDPNAMAYVPQSPGAPHATYVDSTLALDVVQGDPVSYDPDQVFNQGDVLKPYYKVKDVDKPLEVEWKVHDPDGTLAYEDSSVLDPKKFNTDVLSNFSSAGWMDLNPISFAAAGEYTAELWLGGVHCASHPFQMAGTGNEAPYANDDFYVIDEDMTLTYEDQPLSANDLDPDLDPFVAELKEPPAHGVAEVKEDGSFSYTPESDFYGVDRFTYTITDLGGLTAMGEATILVEPVNDPPTAMDDEFEITVSPGERTWSVVMPALGKSEEGTFGEDGADIRIPAPGVLFNDFDPDGGYLMVQVLDIFGDTDKIGADVQEDGGLGIDLDSILQMPPASQAQALISYFATDGSNESEPVIVTITVDIVED